MRKCGILLLGECRGPEPWVTTSLCQAGLAIQWLENIGRESALTGGAQATRIRRRCVVMRACRLIVAALGLVVLSTLLGTPVSAARRPSVEVYARRSIAMFARTREPTARAIVDGLREMNYYPSSGGWTYMWTRFDRKAIDHDFARIHKLGANTVRIIVQPAVFGYPAVKPLMARRLSRVIAMAARHSLRVHLTLFDLWNHPADVIGSKHWVRSLLSPYRGDRRIVLVEVHNEVPPNDAAGIVWVRRMLPYLSRVLPGTLRTVSTADISPSTFAWFVHELAGTAPDVWDYHYYSPAADARVRFAQIKALASPRPLFIGETGASSYGPPREQPALEQAQAVYLREVFAAAAEVGLPNPAPWTLDDFSSGAIPPGRTASNPFSYDYGLFRLDGAPKPAARIVEAAFAGRPYRAGFLPSRPSSRLAGTGAFCSSRCEASPHSAPSGNAAVGDERLSASLV